MFILNQEGITNLLAECNKGNIAIASIVFRDTSSLESYRDAVIECFMSDGIKGVDTVKQCLSIDGAGEVDCIVFDSGSLIFLYALPSEREIPHNQAMICITEDRLFDLNTITEAAQRLDVMEELSKIIENQIDVTPKKRRTRKKEPEIDPLDEWINSLKVIN